MSPTPKSVLQEINGRHLSGDRAGQMLSSFVEMQADGSTSGDAGFTPVCTPTE